MIFNPVSYGLSRARVKQTLELALTSLRIGQDQLILVHSGDYNRPAARVVTTPVEIRDRFER